MRSKFSQFFPPPHYLEQPAVGLDISDMSMRFVELIKHGDEFEIGRFGERAIPRGIIESGEVKKGAELRAILIELKKQHDLNFVVVSLPEEKAYLFDLEIAQMKRNEIRGALELVLEEHVPLKATEALFDYRVIKETETTILVNVSVFPRALTDGYLTVFSEAKITPLAFEIEAHALARSIVPASDMRPSMVIDLGKTRTGITITTGGFVQYTSTASIGGASLTEVIMKQMGVTFDEAEKIKREKGLVGMGANSDVSLAFMSLVDVLRDEINRNFMYWQTHVDNFGKKRPPIEKIYLCGGDANLPGIAEFFAEHFGVSVEVANVFVNTHSLDAGIPKINFSDSLRYATAVGLALRSPCTQGVNLLPSEEKKKNRKRYLLRLGTTGAYVAVFLMIASLALLMPSYIMARSKKSIAETRIENTTGMSAEERARVEKETELSIKELNKKLETFSVDTKATQSVIPPSQTINKILGLKGTTIKVQGIVYEKTPDRERFVITGKSAHRDDLARFVDVLKKDLYFTKVELPLSSYVKSTDISFSLVLEHMLIQKKNK
ncbi:MAG: hypothetical protein A3B07_01315 [Candidatus Yonathbacteria bacterium RIFCSPLOWO2_01_FULL_43_27]|uniref:SHS2 domain-containing protein n=1 Tax=Candidatus Yonathbacteria bacterium RIFCSPLOWO2_01_FULL_43_27 TaxID=1802726 RepID=A0A1G2SCJ7_9BACT|nr:MAG: hypothetical protein A3B07_01315 [Candidatus Yonathbacteria bacterium RIFCSPLOWO2_01_FULL_43_27]